MSDFEKAVSKAFEKAIQKTGIERLKKCSFFIRNEKKGEDRG
jgi:hypothetical protein